MPVKSKPLAPPSDDKRWRVVEAAMRRNGYEGHALIETLHSISAALYGAMPTAYCSPSPP